MKHSDRRGGGSPAKRCASSHQHGHALTDWPARRACRTVVWNEQNLAQCEAGKDAKMKIDEPETPWASPPKELFSDEGAQTCCASLRFRFRTPRASLLLTARYGQRRASRALAAPRAPPPTCTASQRSWLPRLQAPLAASGTPQTTKLRQRAR